jgi:hypothetical protein
MQLDTFFLPNTSADQGGAHELQREGLASGASSSHRGVLVAVDVTRRTLDARMLSAQELTPRGLPIRTAKAAAAMLRPSSRKSLLMTAMSSQTLFQASLRSELDLPTLQFQRGTFPAPSRETRPSGDRGAQFARTPGKVLQTLRGPPLYPVGLSPSGEHAARNINITRVVRIKTDFLYDPPAFTRYQAFVHRLRREEDEARTRVTLRCVCAASPTSYRATCGHIAPPSVAPAHNCALPQLNRGSLCSQCACIDWGLSPDYHM